MELAEAMSIIERTVENPTEPVDVEKLAVANATVLVRTGLLGVKRTGITVSGLEALGVEG